MKVIFQADGHRVWRDEEGEICTATRFSSVALAAAVAQELERVQMINTALLEACKAAFHSHVFDFQRGVGVSEKEAEMLRVRDLLEAAIKKADPSPS